jgi:hypothetical protein
MALIRPTNSNSSSDRKPVIRQPWEHVEDAPITLALGDAGLQGVRFTAEVDLCELDEHGRAGTIWPARSAMLSRSNLVLLSRRMSFVGRYLLVAVHLIDEEPTPLMGRIITCEYHAHGLYKICIELVKISAGDPAYRWAQQRDRR